ncbi:sensor histidine kinase [Paenibacillus tepidiphilus]|uniref:sensor histidine kinase n=1 Tax=Paenibacillus tepidiphilus TaxID=2608683 RepID=UPI0012392CF6|nr:histidine kinase [Paenibacillus tepidiphilus]
MNREFTLLRYGLIIAPAILTIYVYTYDYELFTLHFLLLLLLVTVRARIPKFLPVPAAACELFLSSWLCYHYGFLMIFPAVSTLLSYSALRERRTSVCLSCLHLLFLNLAFAINHIDLLEWAAMNLTLLLAWVLNGLLHKAGRGREETLFLYDELRRKHFELEEARTQLLQFTAQIENATQTEERVRISRQLHDDIGHRLIRVKMMVEAAIHTLPVSPETGLGMMNQIRDQLAASMDEMRAAVKRIHHDPKLERTYDLDQLLEETGRDTGIKTACQVQGMAYPLYPSVQVVLYKNAREAITNALRHGKADAVWITLIYREAEVIMEVANNGVPPGREELERLSGGGGGMGMRGMKERARLIGGTVECKGAAPFSVVTRLPVYRQREIV